MARARPFQVDLKSSRWDLHISTRRGAYFARMSAKDRAVRQLRHLASAANMLLGDWGRVTNRAAYYVGRSVTLRCFERPLPAPYIFLGVHRRTVRRTAARCCNGRRGRAPAQRGSFVRTSAASMGRILLGRLWNAARAPFNQEARVPRFGRFVATGAVRSRPSDIPFGAAYRCDFGGGAGVCVWVGLLLVK